MPESAHILILTNERDFGTDAVIRHFVKDGIPHRRVNAEDAMSVGFPELIDGLGPLIPKRVVWLRQFDASDSPPESLEAAENRLVARAQWRSWMSVLDTTGSTWVNPLWSGRRAENKVVQLQVARACGFSTPTTCITNRKSDAERFADSLNGEVVIKALATTFFELTDQSFVFTERAVPRLLKDVSAEIWARQPVLLQHLIDADFDARLIVFSDHCFGAKLRRRHSTVDWRVDSADDWEEWKAPSAIKTLASKYMSRLGLLYAAFDFLIKGDEIIFLEANQAGEWQFLDRRLDLGIDRSLATYLGGLLELGY